MTSLLITQDGNYLLTDQGKTVSFPTRNLQKQKSAGARSDSGLTEG